MTAFTHIKRLTMACILTLLLSFITGCNQEPKGVVNHTLTIDSFFSACLNNVTYLIRANTYNSTKGYMSVKFNTSSKVVICDSNTSELTENDFYQSCLDNVVYYIRANTLTSTKGYMSPKYNTSSKIEAC